MLFLMKGRISTFIAVLSTRRVPFTTVWFARRGGGVFQSEVLCVVLFAFAFVYIFTLNVQCVRSVLVKLDPRETILSNDRYRRG